MAWYYLESPILMHWILIITMAIAPREYAASKMMLSSIQSLLINYHEIENPKSQRNRK